MKYVKLEQTIRQILEEKDKEKQYRSIIILIREENQRVREGIMIPVKKNKI